MGGKKNKNGTKRVPCPVPDCGDSFDNHKGWSVHISYKHTDLSNKLIELKISNEGAKYKWAQKHYQSPDPLTDQGLPSPSSPTPLNMPPSLQKAVQAQGVAALLPHGHQPPKSAILLPQNPKPVLKPLSPTPSTSALTGTTICETTDADIDHLNLIPTLPSCTPTPEGFALVPIDELNALRYMAQFYKESSKTPSLEAAIQSQVDSLSNRYHQYPLRTKLNSKDFSLLLNKLYEAESRIMDALKELLRGKWNTDTIQTVKDCTELMRKVGVKLATGSGEAPTKVMSVETNHEPPPKPNNEPKSAMDPETKVAMEYLFKKMNGIEAKIDSGFVKQGETLTHIRKDTSHCSSTLADMTRDQKLNTNIMFHNPSALDATNRSFMDATSTPFQQTSISSPSENTSSPTPSTPLRNRNISQTGYYFPLMIKCRKSKSLSGAKVFQLIKKCANPEAFSLSTKNITILNSAVRISCVSRSQREAIKANLQVDPQLKSNCEFISKNPIHPTIEFEQVPNEVTNEEIIQAMTGNDGQFQGHESHFSYHYRSANKNGRQFKTVRFQIHPALWKAIHDKGGFVELPFGTREAKEKVMVRQCGICLSFEHYSNQCPKKDNPAEKQICPKCAESSPVGSRHLCLSGIRSCHNCDVANRRGGGYRLTSHYANTPSCPLYDKIYQERIKNTIYNPEALE